MKRVFVLTGAGISADSGLRTFRDHDGLWEGERVEDVATPEAFERNPARVHDFYNARRRQLADVEANEAHRALARLEAVMGEALTLVTQNVDDLHERGGHRDVWHMHGELLKKRCAFCQKVSGCSEDLTTQLSCERCGKRGGMRPHIVWFGEMPLMMEEIYQEVARADVFIAVGTSGLVYPAAGLAELAHARGARTLEVNLAGTGVSEHFDQCIRGGASECVPGLVDELLEDIQKRI